MKIIKTIEFEPKDFEILDAVIKQNKTLNFEDCPEELRDLVRQVYTVLNCKRDYEQIKSKLLHQVQQLPEEICNRYFNELHPEPKPTHTPKIVQKRITVNYKHQTSARIACEIVRFATQSPEYDCTVIKGSKTIPTNSILLFLSGGLVNGDDVIVSGTSDYAVTMISEMLLGNVPEYRGDYDELGRF